MAAPTTPIRVAVVDDSALMRRIITSALSSAPDIEVVAAAADAFQAREMIRAENPDVITLDVTMPGMSGLDFLEKIMELRPTPVIMVSNLTAEGADISVSALQIGAVEVLQKPQGPNGIDTFGTQLQAKVRLAAAAAPVAARRRGRAPVPAVRAAHPARPPATRSLIAIGASTGGVGALTQLFSALPAGLPPIVVVQHMPKGYPERLAARLGADLHRDVGVAQQGECLRPDSIRFAPGDQHLRIVRRAAGLYADLAEEPPVSGHCPSVDVLFDSVARACGGHALGVILTGMGRDGALGLAAMRRAGAACLAQGPASSVVWGMPRAAVEMGAVDEETEIDEMSARLCHYLTLPVRQGNNRRD